MKAAPLRREGTFGGGGDVRGARGEGAKLHFIRAVVLWVGTFLQGKPARGVAYFCWERGGVWSGGPGVAVPEGPWWSSAGDPPIPRPLNRGRGGRTAAGVYVRK